MRNISAIKVGRHGGGSLKAKLVSSVERVKSLASLPSLSGSEKVLSFSSPEAARVAYGLSIPHFCVSDSPHAEAVSRLTIPLSKMLFTPRVIPFKAWRNYGMDRARIFRYDAIDPVAWLRGFRPDPRVLDDLGLDSSRPILTIRPEESQASYLISHSSDRVLSLSLAPALAQELPESQVVLIPRYDLAVSTKRQVGRRVIVSGSAIDATSLLYYSRVFLGGGGTMTAEAALLGVPTISFYPCAPTYVECYLLRLGLVSRIKGVEAIIKRCNHILKDPSCAEALRTKSRRIMSRMEDPTAVIERHLN